MVSVGAFIAGKIGSSVLFFAAGFLLVWQLIKGFTTTQLVITVVCVIVGVILKVVLVTPIENIAKEARKYGS